MITVKKCFVCLLIFSIIFLPLVLLATIILFVWLTSLALFAGCIFILFPYTILILLLLALNCWFLVSYRIFPIFSGIIIFFIKLFGLYFISLYRKKRNCKIKKFSCKFEIKIRALFFFWFKHLKQWNTSFLPYDQ